MIYVSGQIIGFLITVEKSLETDHKEKKLKLVAQRHHAPNRHFTGRGGEKILVFQSYQTMSPEIVKD